MIISKNDRICGTTKVTSRTDTFSLTVFREAFGRPRYFEALVNPLNASRANSQYPGEDAVPILFLLDELFANRVDVVQNLPRQSW